MRRSTARVKSTRPAPAATGRRRAAQIDAAIAHGLLQRLLAEAGLHTYHIERDEADDSWHIQAIHCTAEGAWKPFHVRVHARELRRVIEDEQASRLLVARLGTSLAPCDGTD